MNRAFKLDCPDGNLNKSKVQKMYSMILPNQNGTALVDHIFRVFDKDSNGYIDFKVLFNEHHICTTSYRLLKVTSKEVMKDLRRSS